MKITKINEKEIVFDNGNRLTYLHEQDCCEHVFADFKNLQVLTKLFHNSMNSNDLDFEEDLQNYIYKIKDVGFEIEDKNGIRLFVSCYNYQNGYYSDELKLEYNKLKEQSPIIIDITDCVRDELD